MTEKYNKKCLVCDSTLHFYCNAYDSEYVTSDDIFEYAKCDKCETISIIQDIKDLNSIYPKNYYSFSKDAGKSILNKIKDFIEVKMFKGIVDKLYGNDLSVLDVGGGTGWVLNSLKKATNRFKYFNIVDIDENAESTAIGNGYSFFKGKIEDYKPKNKFDLIIMLNLIEHVSDPVLVLNSIKDMTKKNGLIVIKTPNNDSLDARIFKKYNWGGLHAPRHFNIFSKESIEILAEKIGLKVESIKNTQGAPQWTTSVMGLLSKYKIIKINKNRSMPEHPIYPIFMAFFALFDFIRVPFSKTSQMFIIFRNI
jgi:2-polyprenyl-3-methyl-5-hydroxy-6-metoxy-1,4-benzoquinol methylase